MTGGPRAEVPAGGRSYPGRGHRYRVAVVGGGPSGCEAAWACTEAGLDTLLVTTSMDTIYNLVGDGWRLEPPTGTLMERLHGEAADATGLVGTWALHRAAKQALERRERLHVLQSSVSSLRVDEDGVGTRRAVGVATWEGVDRLADRVVLAVGSFLRARLRIGEVTEVAGKLSEMAYDDLYEDLEGRGFGFRELELTAGGAGGSLPYRVRCRVLAESELADDHRLARVDRLYGAGLCVRGEIPFERAAADGRDAGRAVAAAVAGR